MIIFWKIIESNIVDAGEINESTIIDNNETDNKEA